MLKLELRIGYESDFFQFLTITGKTSYQIATHFTKCMVKSGKVIIYTYRADSGDFYGCFKKFENLCFHPKFGIES